MKTIYACCLCTVMVCTIVACSPSLKVTTDHDKNANFQQYKTFDLYKVENEKQSVSVLNLERIKNAVRSEIAKKGFQEVTQSPDLLVNIITILKNKRSVTSNTDYYGYGGFYRPYYWGGGLGVSSYTTYDVQNYKDGSIIIDIIDAKTNKLVWEGIGNREIDKPMDNADVEIPKDVASILAKFPPGATAK